MELTPKLPGGSEPENHVGAEVVRLADVIESNRCVSKAKSGDRCGNRSIPGGRVCRIHGGSLPQVQAAALNRIREARDLALTKFHEALSEDEFLDPRLLLDSIIKLTEKVELMEGRATERSESVHLEIREIRATIDAKLNDLAAREKRRDMIL